MTGCSDEAWNNFVMLSEPAIHQQGNEKRAAAIANRFMGSANNGGLNSFLTFSYDLDATEVRDALAAVGADIAARQVSAVLEGLGVELPVASQDDRWRLLDEHWSDELDVLDTLSAAADEQLMAALVRHVAADEDYYRNLGSGRR